MFAPVDLSALLDEMDAHGVQRGRPDGQPRQAVGDRAQIRPGEAGPIRAAIGGFNLLRPMPGLRELGALVNDLPIAYAAVGRASGRWTVPPSDAVYYPLYTKCAELELPLCIIPVSRGPDPR